MGYSNVAQIKLNDRVSAFRKGGAALSEEDDNGARYCIIPPRGASHPSPKQVNVTMLVDTYPYNVRGRPVGMFLFNFDAISRESLVIVPDAAVRLET